MSLARLMSAMEEAGIGGDQRPSTPPKALCATLRAVAARYALPCPFKAGDLVTPRQGGNIRGAGEPHVVLEVINRPEPNFTSSGSGDQAASTYGTRRDIRVACEARGHITAFWMESHELEAYVEPAAASEAPSEAA